MYHTDFVFVFGRIILDVSSLKGGVPGRTRGLNFQAIGSFSNGLNGIDQLS